MVPFAAGQPPGETFIEHTEGGFYHLLRLHPERSFGIAIMGYASGCPIARTVDAIARRA